MFSRPKILFLVSLLFVALLNSIPTYLLNFFINLVIVGIAIIIYGFRNFGTNYLTTDLNALVARVSHQCSATMHNRMLLLITYEEYLNALYKLRYLETVEACTRKIRPL